MVSGDHWSGSLNHARSDLDAPVSRRTAPADCVSGAVSASGFGCGPSHLSRAAGNPRVVSPSSHRTAPRDAADRPPIRTYRVWLDTMETQGSRPGVTVRHHPEHLARGVAVDRNAHADACQRFEATRSRVATGWRLRCVGL